MYRVILTRLLRKVTTILLIQVIKKSYEMWLEGRNGISPYTIFNYSRSNLNPAKQSGLLVSLGE